VGGASEPWHLGKRVNLPLVGALFIQTSGIVWWASAMHSTLQTEVATNDRQDAVLEALKVDVKVTADRFSEPQRILSEKLVEQRADLRAIR
jgi:DNA repair exonuclease SbcCD nuclease subunit